MNISDIRTPAINVPNIPTAYDLSRIAFPEINALLDATQGVAEALRRLGAPFEALAKQNENIATLEPQAEHLGRHGWTVPLWAPLSFLGLLQAECPADELDGVFVEMYRSSPDQPLQMMFRELRAEPNLDHWRPLLQQAIGAFNRRQYRIVVPALLLIYEGVVARAVRRFESTEVKLIGPSAEKVKSEGPGIDRLLWVSLTAFNEEVFRAAPFSGKQPLRINRHWIMHGRARPGWTRADCLRLFQAIHTVSILLPKHAQTN
ncbi:MAG: hypothetical protein M3497_05035 [Gemmatimonadota bacterium]|nr:hypothetical protein [Gemmatimonadota bacterium]